MDEEDLLNHLRELEVLLHQPQARSDPRKLDELLHDSFIEFGRSGRSYCKADFVRELPAEQNPPLVWSQDFAIERIADGVALLTYKSAHLDAEGETSRHTLRASLWQRTGDGWKVRYHQGTPTHAFARNGV